MTDSTENTDPRNTLILRLSANPWIAIVGLLSSLISIPLAIYLYVLTNRYPELVYYVSPARAIVVTQATASRLAVSFDGRPITQDVTAAQMAIWNRGKEAIRPQSVLQPVVIRTDGKVPILEATIRKKSREIVQLELKQSRIASGELELSWNILEDGDGGVLQIVYAGGPNIGIHATGVLEGQPAVRELRYSGTIRSPSEQIRSEHRVKWLVGIGAGVTLLMGAFAYKRIMRLHLKKRFFIFFAVGLIGMPLIMVVLFLYVFATSPSLPPFDFD